VHPALTIDQRGEPRPFDQPGVVNADDGTDIGAFELQNLNVPPVAVDDAYAVTGGGVLSVDARGAGQRQRCRRTARAAAIPPPPASRRSTFGAPVELWVNVIAGGR